MPSISPQSARASRLPWYGTLALLSCQQYLAVSFLYAAVPALLRQEGVSLQAIGWFGMVFLAFSINVLWAPLVDRYPLSRLGRRRSWLLATQLGAVALTAACASIDPAQNVGWLLTASIALATLAATQRMVTHGYAAETLPEGARVTGATVLGWGMSVGNAIGGAAGLMLIERYGWQPTLLGGACLMGGLALCLPAIAEPPPRERRDAASLRALLRSSFGRPGIWRAVLAIQPATIGVAMAFAMAAPWLVDLGLALTQVGLVIAMATLLAFSVIGPLAAVWLRRLTPRGTVLASAALLTPCFALALMLRAVLADTPWTLVCVLLTFGALAIQSIAFNSYFYSLARPAEAATDVALMSAAMSAGALAGFAASGYVAARGGYSATLACALAGYAGTALLIRRSPAAAATRG